MTLLHFCFQSSECSLITPQIPINPPWKVTVWSDMVEKTARWPVRQCGIIRFKFPFVNWDQQSSSLLKLRSKHFKGWSCEWPNRDYSSPNDQSVPRSSWCSCRFSPCLHRWFTRHPSCAQVPLTSATISLSSKDKSTINRHFVPIESL
jgi:hypothetical protein